MMVPRSAVVGLVLSLMGAILDLYSGTRAFQYASAPATSGMGMAPADLTAAARGAVLYTLSGLLLATGVLGVTRAARGRMRIFGGLMVAYGLIMLVIGGSMPMAAAPMTEGAILSGAMLLVGIGMIINGLIMARRREMM